MKQEGSSITLTRPDDFHCHLRTGKLLELTLEHLANYNKLIVAMPNIKERPICDLSDLDWYRSEVFRAHDKLLASGRIKRPVEIFFMIKLTPQTTPALIEKLVQDPFVLAMKYYPEGATTNSSGGIPDLKMPALRSVFRAMEATNLPFSGHFERPDGDFLTREQRALPDLHWLCDTFPQLRIVMEHISSAVGIKAVISLLPRVAGTITIQHMILTTSDVVGQPHNFCLPVAKTEEDRRVVLEAAISGASNFFSGNDSAVHFRYLKECGKVAAGIYNAPVAFPRLLECFDDCGMLDRLRLFSADNGRRFYHLSLTGQSETIEMVKKDWEVPGAYCEGEIVPFLAGQKIAWQAVE